MDFIRIIKEKAVKLNKKIVFPEAFDERTLKAIEVILKEKTAKPILIGKSEEIKKHAEDLKLSIDWNQVQIIDPQDPERQKRYAEAMYQLRKEKGLTLEEAQKLIQDFNYFGVMVVQTGEADGLISGANSSTGDTVRPALQIIGTKEKFHKVSGIFFIMMENRLMLFADCAINIEPNSTELAGIAIDTAETAKRFGIEPKIAMLSFSTNGSAKHPHAETVREATQMVKYKRPDIIIDGEMQVDAALVPEIALKKFPKSKIKGDANILIFPDLQSGNIAYKLVERLAKAEAVGPILQGLQKPVNDLSRGCSFQDIVDLTAITACEAEEMTHEFGNLTTQKPTQTKIA
jgi:phosphate acetyltransferase